MRKMVLNLLLRQTISVKQVVLPGGTFLCSPECGRKYNGLRDWGIRTGGAFGLPIPVIREMDT